MGRHTERTDLVCSIGVLRTFTNVQCVSFLQIGTARVCLNHCGLVNSHELGQLFTLVLCVNIYIIFSIIFPFY